jgi:hypothetical protein
MSFDPNEARDALGRWTDEIAGAVHTAASDGITTAKGNVLKRDTKTEAVRADAGHREYIVYSSTGERLAHIGINNRPDLGGYQVETSRVLAVGKGTGGDAYKSLIKSLDKPLISDSSLTPDAEALWKSLVRQGYARFDKELGKYVSKK